MSLILHTLIKVLDQKWFVLKPGRFLYCFQYLLAVLPILEFCQGLELDFGIVHHSTGYLQVEVGVEKESLGPDIWDILSELEEFFVGEEFHGVLFGLDPFMPLGLIQLSRVLIAIGVFEILVVDLAL